MKETPCLVSQFSQPFRLSSKNYQQGFSGRCCCPERKEEKPEKGAFFTYLFYGLWEGEAAHGVLWQPGLPLVGLKKCHA